MGETGDEPEKIAAIRKIRRLMDFWHIDPSELSGRLSPPPPKPKPASVSMSHLYRHPVRGDTWNGEGSQPDWLRTALIQEGYTVDELRVSARPAQPHART